jgi:hypothetical protein
MTIKKLLVGTALLMSAATAWAIPFTGTYDVSVNTSGSGLQVTANPDSGNLLFNLDPGQSVWRFLFDISTDETTVNADDVVPVQASVDFNFVLPTTFGGTANGDTVGVSLWSGLLQYGVLSWENGGLNSLHFGNGGILDVYLEDATFAPGLGGLTGRSAAVDAKFTYRRAPVAVPEPTTLALIGSGLLLVAWMTRRRWTPRNDRA